MGFDIKTIDKIKSGLSSPRILVVGDVMLDRYWFGEVSRISPEAPVPINKITKIENRPGGAANVARNIASLGGNVTLLTVIGADEAGDTLEQLLKQENVNTLFKRDNTISTTVKLRVISRNQQLIRIDFEDQPSFEALGKTSDDYSSVIKEFDMIVLSDYAKGGLTHIKNLIDIANANNKPVLIDPKGSDYLKYSGATIITPNRSELRDAVGNWNSEKELEQKAFALKNQLGLKYLLLTRSEEGMTLFSENNQVINYPTIAQEVFDVSGAGDTVIGSLALMLANKFAIEDAVGIANIAAGIVVGKLGTATVSIKELISRLS